MDAIHGAEMSGWKSDGQNKNDINTWRWASILNQGTDEMDRSLTNKKLLLFYFGRFLGKVIFRYRKRLQKIKRGVATS